MKNFMVYQKISGIQAKNWNRPKPYTSSQKTNTHDDTLAHKTFRNENMKSFLKT